AWLRKLEVTLFPAALGGKGLPGEAKRNPGVTAVTGSRRDSDLVTPMVTACRKRFTKALEWEVATPRYTAAYRKHQQRQQPIHQRARAPATQASPRSVVLMLELPRYLYHKFPASGGPAAPRRCTRGKQQLSGPGGRKRMSFFHPERARDPNVDATGDYRNRGDCPESGRGGMEGRDVLGFGLWGTCSGGSS